jgi:PHD/YefM family antitoxin component YafN of YafNO toxin-antitoxin module
MTVNEALASVQFVVGEKGKPTAALLDIAAWQRLVEMLEEAEDQGLLQAYLTRRRKASSPKEMGLIPWEEVEAELDMLEAADDARLG